MQMSNVLKQVNALHHLQRTGSRFPDLKKCNMHDIAIQAALEAEFMRMYLGGPQSGHPNAAKGS